MRLFHFVAPLSAFIIPVALHAQGTWTQLATPGELHDAFSVIFTSEDTGFVCGSRTMYNSTSDTGLVYRTVDGGQSWELKIMDTRSGVRRMSFPDAQHGYCLADRNLLYRTSDGGDTWEVDSTGHGCDYTRSVCFQTPLHGYMGGDLSCTGGLNFETHNGGQTWVSIAEPQLFFDMVFIPGTELGYACKGTNSQAIWRTYNSGGFWDPQTGVPLVDLLLGIDFADPMHGCAVGYDGSVVYTDDGGTNGWLPAAGDLGGLDFRDVSLAANGMGVMVGGNLGGGYVRISSDFGHSWSNQNSFQERFQGSCMLDSGVAFIAGRNEVWKFTPDDTQGISSLPTSEPHVVEPTLVSDGCWVMLGGGYTAPRWNLIDGTGQVVMSRTLNTDRTWIDRGTLPAGPYISEVVSARGVSRRKVVLE